MLRLHRLAILAFNPDALLTLGLFNFLRNTMEFMQLTNKRLFLATLLIATCGYAFKASAQNNEAPAPAAGAQPQMQNRMLMGDSAKMREKFLGNDQARMEERFAKHQAMLKAKLKITPEQEDAWTTFSTAMKPPAMGTAGGMGMRHDPKIQAEMDKLPTPERIDKMRAMRQQRMTAMNAEMDKRADATKAFYAALSSEQKAVFDANPMRGRHHGERGMRGEHHDRMKQPS
jgi:periplasmic protein CpxP/Spy